MDRWAALKKQKQQLQEDMIDLEAEQQELKADIVEFASHHGLEWVAGSSHQARVFTKRMIDYPKAGDPRRAEFERTLRR